MNFSSQLIFLLSALGAINGFFLSLYFAFFTKQKTKTNLFLGALLFVLSIRIIKSVFFHFNPNLSQTFIQLGLSACLLIGPFLLLYVSAALSEGESWKSNWAYHVLPYIIIALVAWFFIPYRSYRTLWSPYLVRSIYIIWLLYILRCGALLQPLMKKLFSRTGKLNDFEVLLISIYFGVAIIWLAYFTSRYTSYIVGALTFSFVFYLLLLLAFFKQKKNSIFFEKEAKYANKKIDSTTIATITIALERAFVDKELFKNPGLKLSDVSKEIDIPPYMLSQFLNDNLNKGFSRFINEYRVKHAEKLFATKTQLTLEAIGQESGFKSNSTFYNAFKQIKGCTPAHFKKQLG